MDTTEKEVAYQCIKPYTTLNNFTAKTKNVWFVCHGIGYLSKYFLRYFKDLDHNENYIIAPQAPSKYYLNSNYKHVGASWLTKVDTEVEIENVMLYLDRVIEQEQIPKGINLIILGYSQGVSIATRYVARRQLQCNQLVLMSGGIPKELSPKDFEFLLEDTKVTFIFGNQDEYFDTDFIKNEQRHFYNLFKQNTEIISFDGKHEVKKELLQNLI